MIRRASVRLHALLLPNGWGDPEAHFAVDVDGEFRRLCGPGWGPVWFRSWRLRVPPGKHTIRVSQEYGTATLVRRELVVDVPVEGVLYIRCVPERPGTRLITRRNRLQALTVDTTTPSRQVE